MAPNDHALPRDAGALAGGASRADTSDIARAPSDVSRAEGTQSFDALAGGGAGGRATAGLASSRPWDSLLPAPLRGDAGGQILLALLIGITLLVAILNLAVPASSSLHLSTYAVTLI